MGLDTTHEAWHGAYSAFHRWRCELARLAGLPPLELMEGFFNLESPVTGNPFWRSYEIDKEKGYITDGCIWSRLPIKWDCLKPDPLHELLYHSDCEGEIPWERCKPIARSIQKLIPLMKGDAGGHIGNWKDKTQAFVDGLMLASKHEENLVFH